MSIDRSLRAWAVLASISCAACTGSIEQPGVDGGPKARPPSCASNQPGGDHHCGLDTNEDCCASPPVPGGQVTRRDEDGGAHPATVTSFRLDRFEVTVGRFRAFFDAYPASRPKPGDGAHPLIAGSGWDASWDDQLPATQNEITQVLSTYQTQATWTDKPGSGEYHGLNGVSWYLAFAFCAWDGGRLPTEAEWLLAATAAEEQRVFPWGDAPADATKAVYDPEWPKSNETFPTAPHLPVGQLPMGSSKYGQLDMAGNLWEWVFDTYAKSFPEPCDDCAQGPFGQGEAVGHGGGWGNTPEQLVAQFRTSDQQGSNFIIWGFRCARSP